MPLWSFTEIYSSCSSGHELIHKTWLRFPQTQEKSSCSRFSIFVRKRPPVSQGPVCAKPLGSGVGSGFESFGGDATALEVLGGSTGLGVGFHDAEQAGRAVGHDDVVHAQEIGLVDELEHVAALHVHGLEGPGTHFLDGGGRGHDDVAASGLQQGIAVFVGGDVGAVDDRAVSLGILKDRFFFGRHGCGSGLRSFGRQGALRVGISFDGEARGSVSATIGQSHLNGAAGPGTIVPDNGSFSSLYKDRRTFLVAILRVHL